MSDWFTRYGYAEVAEGLLTGALPADADDVAALATEGITAVYNLCQDVEYEDGQRASVAAALAALGIAEQRLEIVDYGNLLPGHLEHAASAICAWLDGGERVYLHCRAGWQRSATVAAAVVAVRDDLEPGAAVASIQRSKPSAQPLHHQLEDLWRWWRARGNTGTAPG